MASVLKTRAITAFIFAIVVLSLLIISSTTATVLLALIAILTCYEYSKLVYSGNTMMQIATVVVSAILPIVLIWNLDFGGKWYMILLYICLAWSIINIINLYSQKNIIPHKKWGIVVAALYIGIPVGLFISLINNGNSYNYQLPLGIILLIWTSDSMAYIVGRKIGKSKLFPSVSPNKTWEGSIGAGVFTVLAAYIIGYFNSEYSITFWLVAGVVVWIFGTYGDLVESKLKRYYDVKDSGDILPGHGGFLDRFDSFIFVLPYVILLYLSLN